MARVGKELREQIIQLREEGNTYQEIQIKLGKYIPNATLSYICRDIKLSKAQQERINAIMLRSLVTNREKAVAANKRLLQNKLTGYRTKNLGLGAVMKTRDAQLIALAMLYLGEGAKWKSRRGLMLGSADQNIIKLYIALLESCYNITGDKLRGRIQHRADQNPEELLQYWSDVTGIAKDRFYPCYVDKRTIGKTTQKLDYKGVCSITCAGTHVQLELEQIAGIICEAM